MQRLWWQQVLAHPPGPKVLTMRQRLIDPKRLAELEELAQDGKDMRAALKSLESKRLRQMQIIREGGARPYTEAQARGWLEFESDLGDALLKVQANRSEAPF